MNYREWLRTATEDDLARTLCEIQGQGGCGGCVGVNYTGSDGTCSGKPGEAVRKWLQAEKEPAAQPEYKLDEWCTDCKEYDHERHCCPRWNRVIRQTIADAQPERKKGKWVYNTSFTMKCDQCGIVIKDWDWFRFKICPGCGAQMDGGQDEQ